MSPMPVTNPTIFLRLKHAETKPRELAWDEFNARYAPFIVAFARRMGAQAQDADDILQDVLLGFFSKSPTFVYEPSKGRFRGYLKICTYHAAAKCLGRRAKFLGRNLDQIDPEETAVEQVWSDVWEQQQLRQAMDDVRAEMGLTKTFRAFELYVVLAQSADDVAAKLDMHLNSVYRAKEQITQLLREKLAHLQDED